MKAITDLDLNLLKVLLVLLEEKNTGRAAERLNTSQPAVSRTLARLRQEFDDPLFIRYSKGLKLTPKAEELAVNLPDVFNRLQSIIDGNVFLPEKLDGILRIAMGGYLIDSFASKFITLLREYCPELRIEIYSTDQYTSDKLIKNEIDLAFDFYPMQLSKEIYQHEIGLCNVGVLCRKGLWNQGEKISIEQLTEFDLAGLIVPQINLRSMVIQQFTDYKLAPVFRCQHIQPILQSLLTQDLMFPAPKALYDLLDKQLYQLIEFDNSEITFNPKVGIMYNSRHYKSKKYQWFKDIFGKAISA